MRKQHFIDVHHFSPHPSPPHTRKPSSFLDEDVKAYTGPIDSYKDSVAEHHVVFSGTGKTAEAFHDFYGNRSYRHSYRIPLSALEPVVMSDDSDHAHEFDGERDSLTAANVDNPELFESVQARRVHTAQRGKVQPYRNYVEGAGHISFIIPKEHMESLGIQFTGTVSGEKLSDMRRGGASKQRLYGKSYFRHPGSTEQPKTEPVEPVDKEDPAQGSLF